MLYIDEVAIHNFKSFRNATIKFNKGFNCIVGPNGSGKSNICDSLLFAMGETSLKRMRINTSNQLINNFIKNSKDDGFKRASVRVRFSGDRNIEVTRSIRSDRKVSYRLDGKRVTRQEVIEVLRSHNSNINETNTMTQGEITYLLNLNPRQRRELIDIAAGISEFNEKRDAAMKELDKVDVRINETKIMLNERAGYMNELEREKKDAERYTELSNTIKSTNYTLLKMREDDSRTKLEEAAKSFEERTILKSQYEKRKSELDGEITSLSSEKERLTKGMSAKSAEVASTNKILEETNKNIAVFQEQIKAAEEQARSAKERIEQFDNELKTIRGKEKDNYDSIKRLSFELEVKSKALPKQGEDGVETGNLTERYNENYKKLEQTEGKLVNISAEFAKMNNEHENLEKNILEMHKELNELGSRRTTLTNKIKSSKEALSTLEKNRKEVSSALEKEQKILVEIEAKMSALNTEQINLRDQWARLGGGDSDRSMAALKKGLKEGFYGRAQDLCTYEEKHALAVQVAAGARLNYFVVDSIDIANDAIKILKDQKMGRASFIPIKDVVVKSAAGKAAGKPLVDFVSYEKKFEKVFDYIFSATYLVGSVNDARKSGVGSGRFVTLEGDLVETSGVVTGGSIRVTMTAAAVEAKLNKVEKDRTDLFQKQKDANAAIETMRKTIAHNEMESVNYDMEMKHSLEAEEEVHRRMDTLEKGVKDHEGNNKAIKEMLDSMKAERERTEMIAKQLKVEHADLKNQLDAVVAHKGKHSKTKEEAEKLKAMVAEVDKLKVDIAQLTKENEMHTVRIDELEAAVKKERSTVTALKTKSAQIAKEIEAMSKQKAELQTSLESHDKKTSGMFKEVQTLDEKIAKLANDKGKAGLELERVGRDLFEFESKKSQLSTRLADLRAELATYQKCELIKGAKMEELDKQLITSRFELDKLGAVNMKAPEMYESKKKDVEEAKGKMEKLESEKDSIKSMIEEIEKKKLSVFMDTLHTVNENFKKLFNYVYPGESSLKLQDQKSPFESGLIVDVEINGKKHNADLLSGGQKSLMMLMMIFAIQMRRPMAFYVFDEIDVALDKENSKKLSKLIKELSDKSQFIVVSHNDTLISASDTAIGVVNRSNESQVVGIQLSGQTA